MFGYYGHCHTHIEGSLSSHNGCFPLRPVDFDLKGLTDVSLSRSYDLPPFLSGYFDSGSALLNGEGLSVGGGGHRNVRSRHLAPIKLEPPTTGILSVLSTFWSFFH